MYVHFAGCTAADKAKVSVVFIEWDYLVLYLNYSVDKYGL